MAKEVNPFYKTKKWKSKRQKILRRDSYLCRECSRYGKTTPATIVHHIYPLELYPELKLNSDNLLSCCSGCHESFHNKTTDELTDKGKQWMKRVNVEEG